MSELPLQVTVVIPSYEGRARGVNATTILSAAPKVRMSDLDRERIQEMADCCGISLAAFMRQASIHVARAMKEAGYGREGNEPVEYKDRGPNGDT